MSQIILFDLDGTLTDSAEGITKSVQYALQHFGVDEPDLEKLKCFVGPPLKEQFMKYCHMPERQAETAVAVYRERYAKTGIYENKLYDGILELLEMLKEEKKILCVASSKPEIYVRRILEYFQIDQYFDEIVGANMDGSRTKKAEVIEEALERLQATDSREDVLMVGDRSHDVKGALQCGIQCIGAAYGYGGSSELAKAGAIYIANSVEELKILSDRYRTGQSEESQEEGITDAPLPEKTLHSPLRKIWRVLYPIGIHYGVSFVVTQIAAILLFSWYMMRQGGMDFEAVNDLIMEQAVLITGISNVLALIPLSFLYRRDCRLRKMQVLGRPENNRRGKKAGIYFMTVVFAITASHVLNELIFYSGLDKLFPGYSQIQETAFSNQSIFLMILVVGVAAPVVEELLFRGLVLKRIQDYLGNVWAVVLSALIFGLYHGNVVQFVYAGLLGLAFGMIMCRTNSLKVVIAAHMAANLWSVLGSALTQILISKNEAAYYAMLGCFVVLALMSGVYIMTGKKLTDDGRK
ncbi:MAG: HAD hydrolase-like protein [Ruminococcus sp.]|jgi:phosphoglycolate phosphatase-like HAD superfamily hydrolase/membrane protease YdiL (CAAX protease family)